MRISHEAIYQALYVARPRGAAPRADRLPAHRAGVAGAAGAQPRTEQVLHRPRDPDQPAPGGGGRSGGAGPLGGGPHRGVGQLGDRPLVERTTRFTILLHLPRMAGHGDGPRTKNGPALAGHGAEAVRDAITRAITPLPEQLRRSLTWDQAEMAQHAQL